MPRRLRIAAGLACLLAYALRLPGLFANTFHADEALFAGWARLIAVWRDPLLQTQAVDKPPLLFYLQALFFPAFGPVEWAARLPNVVASVLTVALVALLSWNLTRDRAASWLAAMFVALAPLAISFGPTAFIDPLLTMWLMAALALAVRADRAGRLRPFRPALAGLCLGLAVATKYQAWLFLPLVAGLGWLGGYGRREWGRALAGFGLPLLALAAWSAARPGAVGLTAAQIGNIGGVRPAWSWELGRRLAAWAGLGHLALGWPLAALAGLSLVAAVALSRRGEWRGTPAEALIGLFVAGYLLLHWLWAVPVWDRYLLPILPLVAILIARGTTALWRAGAASPSPAARAGVGLVLGTLLLAALWPATGARAGSVPLGGSRTADAGAAAVAGLLDEAPYGTVLYDHWYSWQWRYHLFDKTVYVSWFPHADGLLDDLSAFGGGTSPRYIVLPPGDTGRPVARRLADAGWVLVPVPAPGRSRTDMVLYRLEREGEARP